jgi:hypothetical protein
MQRATTFERELAHIAPGSELLVKDGRGRPVARGILRNDGLSLLGPNGEYIPLHGNADWTLVVLRSRRRD